MKKTDKVYIPRDRVVIDDEKKEAYIVNRHGILLYKLTEVMPVEYGITNAKGIAIDPALVSGMGELEIAVLGSLPKQIIVP